MKDDSKKVLLIGLVASIPIGAFFALITYTSSRQWPVIALSIGGILTSVWFAGWMGWFKAPSLIGVPVRFVIAVVVFGTVFGYPAYKVWPSREGFPDHGFNVRFRGGFVNMSRDPNADYRYGFLSGLVVDRPQISPIALVLFLDVDSYYPNEVSVDSYSMTITTKSCGETNLVDLNPDDGMYLYVMKRGLSAPAAIVSANETLEKQFRNPFPPNSSKHGLLFFATKENCPVRLGERIKLRLKLVDKYEETMHDSGETVVEDEPGSPRTISNTTSIIFPTAGVLQNADDVPRANYLDENGGYAFAGNANQIQLSFIGFDGRSDDKMPRISVSDGIWSGLREEHK